MSEECALKYCGIDVSKATLVCAVVGYLPERGRSETPLKFKESEYHALYEAPHNWVNHIQIEFFRENVCLFIGLSLLDPNLRRLLRIASTKHSIPVHIASMKWSTHADLRRMYERTLEVLLNQTHVTAPILNRVETETVMRVQSSLKELDLRDLKVNIDWLDTYSDIRERLQMISS